MSVGADVSTLGAGPELDQLGASWDTLVASRGIQADLFDTHTWLRAWLAAAPSDEAAALRVPALVGSDGALRAALPVLVDGKGGARAAGLGSRPRFRPLVGGEAPGADAAGDLARLVEALAREGVREIELPALPRRDPATELLSGALGECGFEVDVREGTEECLVLVDEGGWDAHRKRFKKFDRTVKNFTNKAARLGEVDFEAAGGVGGTTLDAAFETYVALHGQGWKGAMKERTRRHRRALIELSGEKGWARIYTMRVAGVPVASIVWFVIGRAAIAYSTVYDTRLAALSGGTIVMWRAHERIFAEGAPALVDYLPGHGPQKDQLGVDRSRLVTLRAQRGAKLVGLTGALRRGAKAALGAARRAVGDGGGEAPRTVEAPGRRTRIEPAGEALPVAVLELEPARELYLAVAGGFGSPKKMREIWAEGDAWLAVGGIEAPRLLARVGPEASGGAPREVREIVAFGEQPDDAALLATLAAALGGPVAANVPDASGADRPALEVRRAILPWVG
jgi:CelD/BcsL family acetyltransferase involved in cellulose biosynthesis